MESSLSKKDLLTISFMTFAMFLGAGNIIFPTSMGLAAGTHLLPTVLGFLLTAVGLPAFCLIVLGRVGETSKLTEALPVWLNRTFWILLFTVIGPAFGLPRVVTVAYEMGLKPFMEGDNLLLFSLSFSILTLLMAYKPGKLIDYLGKYMTPLLIVMLAVLSVATLLSPLDTPREPVLAYEHSPFGQGLIQGYLTMDIPAALAFGWVIIHAIRSRGASGAREVAKASVVIAVVYSVLMGSCYFAMSYLGASASSVAGGATNGGEILTLYTLAMFGQSGQLLLAAIILLACLTTAVGLTNACAEYYQATFRSPFALTSFIVITFTAIIANLGLEQIIMLSLPVILVLCPVAFALILVAFFESLMPRARPNYLAVLLVTLIFGVLDAMHMMGWLPGVIHNAMSQTVLLQPGQASWLLPCLVTLLLSAVLSFYSFRPTTLEPHQ